MRLIANVLYGVILLLMACETPTPTQTGDCIPVKLVRGICGTAVFKIEDPTYYHFGEDVGGEENVFLGTIECSYLRTSASVHDSTQQILYVELNPENFALDCARCYAMVNYSGSKSYNVRIHEQCNSVPGVDDGGQ